MGAAEENAARRESYLRDGERLVDLERSNLWLIQHPGRFCFGMDAVLLSAFTKVRPGERVLDMGTGTGILPLLLSAKTEAGELIGLEIQSESAEMAARSVQMNGLSERIHIVEGDIKEASKLFGKSSFDVVTCNPPYMTGGHGIVNPSDSKTIARHETLCTFEDVAREAALCLRPGGRFFLVHRPFRLAELMLTLTEYGLEPKRLRMVHPYVDKEPNMILMECVRGGKRRISVEAPLIVFDKPDEYTQEVNELYGF